MATPAMEALYDRFEATIDLIPDRIFTSHQFFRKLAQHNQRLYVEALYHYRDSNTPFMIVHGQLAKQLNRMPERIVLKQAVSRSRNIWDEADTCALWEKVN